MAALVQHKSPLSYSIYAIAALVKHAQSSVEVSRLLRCFSLLTSFWGFEHDAHLLSRTSNCSRFLASTLCPLCPHSADFLFFLNTAGFDDPGPRCRKN